jgi:hypothetical protein
MFALRGEASYSGSNTITIGRGATTGFTLSGPGTIGSSSGLYGYLIVNAGIITEGHGLLNRVGANIAGTITTAMGVDSGITQTAGGTITTGYLFKGAFTGTIGTKYGIVLTGDTSNSFDGDLDVKGGDLTVGVSDTVFGKLSAYGQATGSDEGGELLLYLAADHDTTISYFRVQAEQDDLLIGPDTDADALKLDALKDLYVTAGSVLIAATEYLNFGTTQGTTGYGIRDNSNVIEFKDSGGAWRAIRHMDSTPDADHQVDGLTFTGTAGENLTFGDCCYFKSDGKYWKADADAAATAPVVAMATATINADATGTFLAFGFARDDTWDWTVGDLLYLDEATAGGMDDDQPTGNTDIVQVLGYAYSADVVFFNPNMAIVEVTA